MAARLTHFWTDIDLFPNINDVAATRRAVGGFRTKERCSFLKKRTKKLLSVLRVRKTSGAPERQTDESFLLLFFKKEVLLYSSSSKKN
jgi:hypothetical protein